MNVLFVCSGNSKNGISPIIQNQAESLKQIGCIIDFYTINGRGLLGYLANVPKLKRIIQKKKILVHAHYSFSALVATLAGAKPLVVSLMGSDLHMQRWYKWLLRKFSKSCWDITIVKSKGMKDSFELDDVIVIPNGVDLTRFTVSDKKVARCRLGWSAEKTHLLFAADPCRYEKNYNLAVNALKILDDPNIELHFLDNVEPVLMPLLYGASDIVLLCSFREGSPNVIKEALACNCLIVSTDVGDVRWVFGNTEGCYIASFDPHEFAAKIKMAISFLHEKGRTEGRQRILQLGLDAVSIAKRISQVYTIAAGSNLNHT